MQQNQKKLQPKSAYNELDLDGDGVVSDNEMKALEALDRHERNDSQRHMSWVALCSMLIVTALVFLPIFSDTRIEALDGLFSLFYISMGGIVAAFFGAQAFVQRGKK
tara:strand:- start:643 stop:963 length:321 start_codon:yes stop_codon:yes gene_type:complete